jgi:hypothetical protein
MNTSTSLTIKSPKTNICGFPSPMSYLWIRIESSLQKNFCEQSQSNFIPE